MSQDSASKSALTRPAIIITEPTECSDIQTAVRVDPFQGLSSNKLSKNLVKLRPVDARRSNIESAGSSNSPLLGLEGKKRKVLNNVADAPGAVEAATGAIVAYAATPEPPKRGNSVQARNANRRERTSDSNSPSILPTVKPNGDFYTPIQSKKDVKPSMGFAKAGATYSDEKAAMKVWPASTTNASLNKLADSAKDLKSALKAGIKHIGAEMIKAVKPQPESMPELREQVLSVFEPFRRLIFGPNVEEHLVAKHASILTRGLHYSLKLLKPPPLAYVKSKQVTVKELRSHQKTLILDLDETLVNCCQNDETPDVILPLVGDPSIKVKLRIRPYSKEFLMKMKEHYEIIAFTASTNLYAETVVRELDPENKYISYLLDRSFCLETKSGYYIKDLRILKNRDLKNMIIVDNLVHSFGFQIDNGVPILEWRGDKSDQELKHLMEYLIKAKDYEDVRVFNRERLNLTELAQYKVERVVQSEQKVN